MGYQKRTVKDQNLTCEKTVWIQTSVDCRESDIISVKVDNQEIIADNRKVVKGTIMMEIMRNPKIYDWTIKEDLVIRGHWIFSTMAKMNDLCYLVYEKRIVL